MRLPRSAPDSAATPAVGLPVKRANAMQGHYLDRTAIYSRIYFNAIYIYIYIYIDPVPLQDTWRACQQPHGRTLAGRSG